MVRCAGSAAPPVNYANRLRYCAPEAVADAALPLEQQPPVLVDCAADIWAIGVIAFELLTEERIFPPEATAEDMMGELRGRGLPWEAGVSGQANRRKKLCGLKRTVMACLERDASKRPSAQSLLSSWETSFDTMKTQGTFDSSAHLTLEPTATAKGCNVVMSATIAARGPASTGRSGPSADGSSTIVHHRSAPV